MSEIKNVKGLSELQKFLDTLPAKMEANIMRSALRAGANVLKTEAASNLDRNGSVDSGDLKASLRVSSKLSKGVVTATVKAGSDKAWYWRFVEFGTAAHVIKARRQKSLFFNGSQVTSVDHPGARAKPFMRPALDARASDAVVAVGEQIKKRLTKQGINAADVEIEAEE